MTAMDPLTIELLAALKAVVTHVNPRAIGSDTDAGLAYLAAVAAIGRAERERAAASVVRPSSSWAADWGYEGRTL